MPRVLITGSGGQLGRELVATKPDDVELLSCSRAEFDICDARAVRDWIQKHRPQIIINAAGYTAVDRAESEPEAAFQANGSAPGYLAEAISQVGGRLIHVSTDYVFDGDKGTPYRPSDLPRPISVYGKSKYDGEERISRILGKNALVLRTSWLYSSHGHNFVRTVLRLLQERDEIRIVCDQIGTPTWARGLARALWVAAEKTGLGGILHWTDAGVASWYDFAVAIQEEAVAQNLRSRAIPIVPIRREDYPAPAARPPYSVLDKHESWNALGILPSHWRTALREMLRELRHP